ncbi:MULTISPECIES: hypothetical protein [Rhizobium]|uniref:DUF883 domain-containing protein n=1 Tax=Rhizobium tropici TaxID=398 RepID=A0A329Y6Z8_RHITR|nr:MULTISPECIES: hypothetical protein [Rhizobium]MBB3285981.1 ElaB/YqjD/DUF883 family membrane-anchored ribosome-binding protein [Rhizobium sp. BK252]MBB3400857.1 ElaB/YqjD/DUF883 family membrane-anchored ribosome-binding protein [Rhizobium sp. BK289]MBB3413299.1 ElaB/YqjD/DUF883 family membrane-anchored ribosome-binding protein [Rhizobium sp. BK284]MBB3481323.1 ElaB/YqjD/DUF883 family membrane-anchored ribosome-binding protein [Rhizobium sp. BK347]MDK4723094.1 hypothetical protein [Rhizobium 
MADVSLDKDINAQIDELRRQISKLSTVLKTKIDTATDRADETLYSSKAKAASIADQARSEGRNVVQAARENPTATSSILIATALLGVLTGLLLGKLSN